MPLPAVTVWPSDKTELARLGAQRVRAFCLRNRLPVPDIFAPPRDAWDVDACAYYRPHNRRGSESFFDLDLSGETVEYGGPAKVGNIWICLAECGRPCGEAMSRNWTWPASGTDREPCGVLAHELGHHVDWLSSDRRGSYSGEYGEAVMRESREPPLTSYAATNPAEWWAEAFRLFLLNPDLLDRLRPRTHSIIVKKFQPIETRGWLPVLGQNVPDRVVKSLRNKGVR